MPTLHIGYTPMLYLSRVLVDNFVYRKILGSRWTDLHCRPTPYHGVALLPELQRLDFLTLNILIYLEFVCKVKRKVGVIHTYFLQASCNRYIIA